jgi:hypothetical protein
MLDLRVASLEIGGGQRRPDVYVAPRGVRHFVFVTRRGGHRTSQAKLTASPFRRRPPNLRLHDGKLMYAGCVTLGGDGRRAFPQTEAATQVPVEAATQVPVEPRSRCVNGLGNCISLTHLGDTAPDVLTRVRRQAVGTGCDSSWHR